MGPQSTIGGSTVDVGYRLWQIDKKDIDQLTTPVQNVWFQRSARVTTGLLGEYVGGNGLVCVCCFVLLNGYWAWGIVTVPGSFLFRVTGSSPSTLTTSLATLVPSFSSSNGPSNYYVDNQGLVPWRLRRLGRSKVALGLGCFGFWFVMPPRS